MRMKLLLSCIAATALAAGCSEDDPTPPPDPLKPLETLYAVTATQYGTSDSTSYVALVPSLGPGTPIDLPRALDVAGGSSIFGLDGKKFFALGTDLSPTVTRYDISDDNKFVPSAKQLTLLSYGLDTAFFDPGWVPFISETKAYFIDTAGMQVIVWNPTSMEVTGSFPLDGVTDADFPDTFIETNPTKRGNQLLIALTHGKGDETAGFSTLVVIDTNTDTISRVVRDDRCGGLYDSVMDSKGDLYLATGVWTAAQYQAYVKAVVPPPANPITPEPCMVRVKAGETEFDPTFLVKTSELTGGNISGALVAADGDWAYLKALDETLLTADQLKNFDEVWARPAWRYWKIQLGSTTTVSGPSNLPPAAAVSGEINVDGKSYARNVSDDFAETTLVDMAGDQPKEQIKLPGFMYASVRIR